MQIRNYEPVLKSLIHIVKQYDWKVVSVTDAEGNKTSYCDTINDYHRKQNSIKELLGGEDGRLEFRKDGPDNEYYYIDAYIIISDIDADEIVADWSFSSDKADADWNIAWDKFRSKWEREQMPTTELAS
jgi:hypothetical protein